jgi:hypothetical protein
VAEPSVKPVILPTDTEKKSVEVTDTSAWASLAGDEEEDEPKSSPQTESAAAGTSQLWSRFQNKNQLNQQRELERKEEEERERARAIAESKRREEEAREQARLRKEAEEAAQRAAAAAADDGSRCSRRSTWTLREWLQRTWLEARRTWGCRTSAGSTLQTSVGASQTLTPKTLTSVVFAVRRGQNCCMRAQMTTGAATSATRSRVSDCICTYLSPLLCFSCLAWLREFTGGLAPRIPHARPRQLSWIY